MAPKDRADQIEQRSPLRLPNKISDASPVITSKLRYHIKEEIEKYRRDAVLPHFFLHMATLTTLLPPHWESFPADLKMFVEKEMFDPVLKHILESEELLNWCPTVRKVHPLITPGDGNCLLHAVSLALWAVEDDELLLRTALYQLLKEGENERNFLRWQRERMRVDAGIPGSGLMYNSTEWRSEWEIIKDIASPQRRPVTAQGLPFESLEQFHVFMLANMLRRPIIVVAQDMMRSQWGHSLQPQNLQGIYLPLNWDPSVCYHYPILLGFHMNHFTPLLCTAKLDSEDDDNDYLFPIVQQDLTPMAVHFLEENEEKQENDILNRYLIVEEIIHMGKSFGNTHGLPGVRLVSKSTNPELDLTIPYLQLAETHYRSYLEKEFGNASQVFEPAGFRAKEDMVGEDKENAYLEQEKPTSLPSISQRILQQQAKNSWSGSGAPVSQPSDQQASDVPALQNPPFKRAFSLVHQNCKTVGCIYYRSVSTGEYCHECFQKKAESLKCQGDGCLNPSEQGCQGLCRVCFDQNKLMAGAINKATAPSMSKMSIDPISNCAVAVDDVNFRPGLTAAGSKPRVNILATRPLQKVPDEKAPSSQYAAGASSTPSHDKAGIIPGQTQSPYDELNSFVVHQKLAIKKCIIPECPLTGQPKMNDMCSKCYNESIEIERKLKTKQVSQHTTTTTNTTSSGACGLAEAAAKPSEALYPEQKRMPKYTVQKNICASAGCDGVRLVDSSYFGYCINCYNKNIKKFPQASTISDPAFQARPQQANLQKTVSQNPFADPAAIPGNLTVTSAPSKQEVPAAEMKAKRCIHPRCDQMAAPPKFLLCGPCIFIASMYQDKVAEVGSTLHEAGSNTKQEPQQAEANQEATKLKQIAQPAASAVENPKPLPSKTSSGFKNVHIHRIKCQIPGGCPDNMFGDPHFNNLCSRCSSKMIMKRTRTRTSPTCLAETKPTQSPTHQGYNTAPLNPSARASPPPPRANTEYLGNRAGKPVMATPKTNPVLPTNYIKCSRPGCNKQANLQILEGYCNDCHQVYRQQGLYGEVPVANPGPQMGNRGRFAFSSQSTVPEGWMNAGAPGYGTGTERGGQNEEIGFPPPAEPNRTDMGCKSNGCTNFGNPRCQGYCNSCFRHIKK